MRTILVSGASGIVGYGILRSLKASGQDLRLVGSSIHDDSVAPGFCDVFELAPHTEHPSYIEWLLNTIRKHRVDLIVPGIEIDLYEWTAHAAAIAGSGALALLNNPELVALSKDKWLFHERLRDLGFATAHLAGTLNASAVFGMDQGALVTTGNPYAPPHPLAGTSLGEIVRRRAFDLQDARDLTDDLAQALSEA